MNKLDWKRAVLDLAERVEALEEIHQDVLDQPDHVENFEEDFREEITEWNSDSVYVKGDLVRYKDDFYVGIGEGAWRTKNPSDLDYWQKLDKLPEDNVDIDVYAYLTRNGIKFNLAEYDGEDGEWQYIISESDIKKLIKS